MKIFVVWIFTNLLIQFASATVSNAKTGSSFVMMQLGKLNYIPLKPFVQQSISTPLFFFDFKILHVTKHSVLHYIIFPHLLFLLLM